MSPIIVDPEKCKRDNICSMECPMVIIAPAEGDSVPTLRAGGEELCIHCGHCVAVCPHGALSLHDMPADKCPPAPAEPSDEYAEHFLRRRRSMRVFADKTADHDTLARLIEIARYAPTGHNKEHLRWMVFEKPETVRDLAAETIAWMRDMLERAPEIAREGHMDMIVMAWDMGMDVVLRGAPHMVLCLAPADDPFGAATCATALAYVELAAPSLGLGTCWAGYFTVASGVWQPLKDKLALPKGYAMHGALMTGIPKFKYYRLPQRKEPVIDWR